jgi:ribose transport system substrate-binding protein
MKNLKVVLSLITRDNDYQREQAAAAEAAARRLGIALQVLYADNDAILQTKQILESINVSAADRPNAVIAEPVGTGMPGVASAAVGKGVGWIVMNREADYLAELRQKAAVPVGSVESDNVEIGRIQGRQFAALLPGGGSVLYIEGPGTEVTRQRRSGVDETLPASIELKPVKGKWTEDSGYQLLASRLGRPGPPPSFGIIGCQNDAMAMGARRAVEELADAGQREMWLKVPFTGVDGVPTGGQQWVQKGLLAATVVAPTLTGVALEMIAKAIADGAQIPERTLLKPVSYPVVEQLRGRS